MTLREGFTTGTAAAAAAKAGVLVLLGRACTDRIDVPLPNGDRLRVPVARCEPLENGGVRAVVVKDAGDDPDATHMAEIHCLVETDSATEPGQISLGGGRGVGTVTLPGLPVPPGEPAINPAPRRQIVAAALEALDAVYGADIDCQMANDLAAPRDRPALRPAIRLTIEVPEGEARAKRTMNERLGIKGGISILGTRGTVRPFSHESWQASIDMAMDVAKAAGHRALALATGGRTARLAGRDRPDIPDLAVVQMADFFAHSLASASDRGFTEIVVACFFGKLAKMAQGAPYTHAKSADLDKAALAEAVSEAGLPHGLAKQVSGANTAAHALDMVMAHGGTDAARDVCGVLVRRAMDVARSHAGPGPVLEYRVYTMDGHPLAMMRSSEGTHDHPRRGARPRR